MEKAAAVAVCSSACQSVINDYLTAGKNITFCGIIVHSEETAVIQDD